MTSLTELLLADSFHHILQTNPNPISKLIALPMESYIYASI